MVTAAYAASVRALAAILVTLNEQITALQGQVEAHFGQHPTAEIIPASPAWDRSWNRKNYAGTRRSPAPPARRRSPGPVRHNDRLIDALSPAFSALASPGARAYYGAATAARIQRRPPARQPLIAGADTTASKPRTLYDEATA